MLDIKIKTIPTHQINGTIEWLESIKADCNFKIYQLKMTKRRRAQAQKHRDMMNDLARRVYNEGTEFLDTDDHDTQILVIVQRLDCNIERAKKLYDTLKQWTTMQKRKDRDQEIVLLARTGMKKVKIAEKYKITRQQVYNVIREHQKGTLFKE